MRLFNTVGPRQSAAYSRVILGFVEQALAGDPLTVYGDGERSRCFCHVHDSVARLIALLDHPDAIGEVFNIGSGSEISMRELADEVLRSTGSNSSVELIPYGSLTRQASRTSVVGCRTPLSCER